MRVVNYIVIILLSSLSCKSPIAAAQDTHDGESQKLTDDKLNLLTVGFSQFYNDYFGDNTAQIEPTGLSISYARQISENWIMSLNYLKEKGDGRWPVIDRARTDLFDSAKTNSKTYGISSIWQFENFDISVSYGEGDSSERAELFLPHINETLTSDEQVASISYGHSFEFGSPFEDNQWSLDWSAGIQYAKFDVTIIDPLFADPPIDVNSRIKQTSTSAFTDLVLSYWIKGDSFSWSPYASISWSWEFSSKGDELVLINRGDRVIVLDEPGARFSNSVRTPNSGRVELGLDFSWDNGFSTRVGYSKDLATEFDSESLLLDISVAF